MKKVQRDEQGRILSAPDSYDGKPLSIRLTREAEGDITAISKELGVRKTEWARSVIEEAVKKYKKGKSKC